MNDLLLVVVSSRSRFVLEYAVSLTSLSFFIESGSRNQYVVSVVLTAYMFIFLFSHSSYSLALYSQDQVTHHVIVVFLLLRLFHSLQAFQGTYN